MIFKLFKWLEDYNNFDLTTFRKIQIFIFCPIILLLEYICYSYFWKKIILTELVTKDTIIEFLNKQEFGFNYWRTKIYKKSLIDTTSSFFREKTNQEIKEFVKKEYVNLLSEIIGKSSSFNIENYITVIVDVDDKISNINGQIFSNKIFSVELQFVRLWYLKQLYKKMIYWIAISGILIFSYIILK